MKDPEIEGKGDNILAKEAPTSIHVHVNQDIVKCFIRGYLEDKDFALVRKQILEERLQDQKYQAYCIADNGLMYFEDANSNIRLCMPSSERSSLIQEVHDLVHKTAHVGWECTLASLQTHYYWLFMRHNVTNYVCTCDPCQKIKHD